MIKLFINDAEVSFELTKFPDETSQIWKITNSFIFKEARVLYLWEGDEAENFHMNMLLTLLTVCGRNPYGYSPKIILDLPFFPYGRQDRAVSNESTFARTCFLSLIPNGVEIKTFDLHSPLREIKFSKMINYNMDKLRQFHRWVHTLFKPDIIFYPDKGAYTRYEKHVNEIVLFGEKVRDQATGKITEYKIHNTDCFNLKDRNILILDDLCDFGNTFISAANELNKYSPSKIGLCVSHGLFSGGFDNMKAAGISEFYYTNSLLKNKDGYKVWE